MPEPFTRCAECDVTYAAHDDPEVDHCPTFQTAPAPLLISPMIPVATAAPTSDRFIIERMEGQLNEQGADLALVGAALAEAEAVNTLWGGFDYELDILAERFGIELDPDRAPLDAVRALMTMARNAPEIPIYSEEVAP